MKKLSLIAEALPPRKQKQQIYNDALRQFASLDVESARIEAEDMYASSLICSINSVIKNSDEFRDFKAVMREGKPYLAKVSALENTIDSILEG